MKHCEGPVGPHSDPTNSSLYSPSQSNTRYMASIHIYTPHALAVFPSLLPLCFSLLLSKVVGLKYNVKVKDIELLSKGQWAAWSHEVRFSFLEAGLVQYLDGSN